MALSAAIPPAQDAGAALAFLLECGVDTLISEQPRNWLAAPPAPVTPPREIRPEIRPAAAPAAAPSATPLAKAAPLPPKAKATPLATDLAALALEVANHAHPLNPGQGAAPILLEGPEHAAVLLLTDTPMSPDSEAGHLIAAMMGAIGLKMADIARAPLVPWPTNGRAARPEELSDFAPFAAAAARLARPQMVLALGPHLTDALLEAPASPGNWQTLGDLPLLTTLSPARLLRSPQLKAQAWAHLQSLKDRLS